jgi:Fur family ferric uptake transcriptional regulator
MTRPRQIVLEVVRQANRRLTPGEIYSRAKARYARLGYATVYRTLDLLVLLGDVEKVHLEHGCHSYVSVERAHGHHLVCSTCGRSEEFSDCAVEPLIKTLRARTGYSIDEHMLELMGQCPSCQKKSQRRRVKGRTPSSNR